MKISVKCFENLEQCLADELIELGATDIQLGKRIVHAETDLRSLYQIVYRSRIALRVLFPVLSFTIHHKDELYRRAKSFKWEEMMHLDQTFAIDPVVKSRFFRHEHYASQLLKDAIVDRFNAHHGQRPNVDSHNPQILFHLHIDDGRATIALDASGFSLNQRGYRISGGTAPINESLAAGLIRMSGWKGMGILCDPFCGSGTLAIEAAHFALKIPAQIHRKEFCFQNWPNYDQSLWENVKQPAPGINEEQLKISISDISEEQLNIARRNIQSAGLQSVISLERIDFFELNPPSDRGYLVSNIPYGNRVSNDDSEFFVKNIGNRLKHVWSGFHASLLIDSENGFKHIGLKPDKKWKVLNGSIPCTFANFKLFRGSLADKKRMEND
jgi:putative N6-adenine-specific DNA methylase